MPKKRVFFLESVNQVFKMFLTGSNGFRVPFYILKISEDQNLLVFQDQNTKEKALQNMSSSAHGGSGGGGNNKSSSGISGLGLPAPVSYPPPVIKINLLKSSVNI